jgi:hypothetical protein
VFVLDALDAVAVHRWSATALVAIEQHRREIDELNVFPVPDGDTGSNLLHTLRAADAALATLDLDTADTAAALAALADGAARGAVGNSGFIVSQILRGLAEAAGSASACDGVVLAAGLENGSTLARAAVFNPVDGTILTVARAAAAAARAMCGDGTLAEVVSAAVAAGDAALQRTTAQLADLAAAGVVDAGGRGLVLLLDALAETVTGAALALTPVQLPARPHQPAREAGSAEFGFEVQYQLEASADAVDMLRVALGGLGDSVAVVPTGERTWNVHVHVNDVGAAIEAGVEAGRPHHIAVVRFAEHHAADGSTSAILAVAPGVEVAHLFEIEGVPVVEGTPDELVAAIRGTGAADVVLLSCSVAATETAEVAARQIRPHGVRVSVVPTRSPVQALAAVAVHDPARRFDDDVVAMAEAAAATRFVELIVATEEALTSVGICQPGDVLGLIDGEVVEIGHGLLAVAYAVVDRVLGVGAELMTVLVGNTAPGRTGEQIAAHVREMAPFTEVALYPGGPADRPVIIGVE